PDFLAPFLCQPVSNLCQCLCPGDADTYWNARTSKQFIPQTHRQCIRIKQAVAFQVAETFIDAVNLLVGKVPADDGCDSVHHILIKGVVGGSYPYILMGFPHLEIGMPHLYAQILRFLAACDRTSIVIAEYDACPVL